MTVALISSMFWLALTNLSIMYDLFLGMEIKENVGYIITFNQNRQKRAEFTRPS